MTLGQSSYFLASGAAARSVAGRTAAPAADAPVAIAGTDGAATVDAAGARAAADRALVVETRSRRTRALHAARGRVDRQVREHPLLTTYVVTSLPTPMTTLATAASAAVGTPYARWAVAALAGYLTFCTILAVAGQGLLLVLRSLLPLGAAAAPIATGLSRVG